MENHNGANEAYTLFAYWNVLWIIYLLCVLQHILKSNIWIREVLIHLNQGTNHMKLAKAAYINPEWSCYISNGYEPLFNHSSNTIYICNPTRKS